MVTIVGGWGANVWFASKTTHLLKSALLESVVISHPTWAQR